MLYIGGDGDGDLSIEIGLTDDGIPPSGSKLLGGSKVETWYYWRDGAFGAGSGDYSFKFDVLSYLFFRDTLVSFPLTSFIF